MTEYVVIERPRETTALREIRVFGPFLDRPDAVVLTRRLQAAGSEALLRVCEEPED